MNDLTRFERRFDELVPAMFRRFMQPMKLEFDVEPIAEIRIDLQERDKDYVVRAEIPGATKDDIRVEVDGNRVSISAEIKRDREQKDDGRTLVRETYRGSTSRAFSLAHDIDETQVAAKLENGVLNLTLPKREGTRSRLVSIQ